MMKKRWFSIVMLFLVLFVSCNNEVPNSSSQEESSSSEVDVNPIDTSSYFQFTLNNISYQMPFRMEEFLENGWTFEDQEIADTLYAPYQGVEDAVLSNGSEKILVGFVNYQKDSKNSAQCYAMKITFYPDSKVQLAKEMSVDTTSQDIIKAYGTPAKSSEDQLAYTLKGLDGTVTGEMVWIIDSADESRKVKEMTLLFYTIPEDTDEPAYLSNPVDYQSDYTAPASLSNELQSYQIQMQEVVYELPVPVKTLLEDGWVFRHQKNGVSEDLTPEELKEVLLISQNTVSMSNLWIEKGDCILVVTSGINQDDIAQPFLNSYVSGVSGSTTGVVLPGGITAGSTKEAVVSAYGTDYLGTEDSIQYDLGNGKYLQLSFQDNLLVSFVYVYDNLTDYSVD